jgi:hypothetical protein
VSQRGGSERIQSMVADYHMDTFVDLSLWIRSRLLVPLL